MAGWESCFLRGCFNNITDQEIRDFVDEHARVLAVVGIHPYTFKPFTLAKTSVLFLQKWREGEHLQDYPVFTAVSMRPGKTKLGRPHFMDDGVTLNCDMPEIAGSISRLGSFGRPGFRRLKWKFNIVRKSDFSKHRCPRIDSMPSSSKAIASGIRTGPSQTSKGMSWLMLRVPIVGRTLNETFAPCGTACTSMFRSTTSIRRTVLRTAAQLRYEDRPSRAKYETEAGDLLISNVRPNRNAVALVTERLRRALASSGFTLVRAGRNDFPAEYLFAFMKTRHFIGQMLRRNRGSMYPAVLPSDVLSAWIPEPSDVLRDKVVHGVRICLARQEAFFGLLAEGERRLEEFLAPMGAPPSPLDTRRSGADWTQVPSGGFFAPGGPRRLDAEFFRGEYQEFEDRTRTWGRVFRLGEAYSLRQAEAPRLAMTAFPSLSRGCSRTRGSTGRRPALNSAGCRQWLTCRSRTC